MHAALRRRQQVHAERGAVGPGHVDSRERRREWPERGYLRIDHAPRNGDQFGIQLAVAVAAAQHARIEGHGIGGKWRLAVDLEADHVAKPLRRGRRQHEATAQSA